MGYNGIWVRANVAGTRIRNVIVWDTKSRAYLFTGLNAGAIIENCESYNCPNGISTANIAGLHINNCRAFAASSGAFQDRTNVVGKNNMSDDATCSFAGTGSTGNIINATVLDNVTSTDDTSADFLVTVVGSPSDNGGYVPEIAANTSGIDGVARSALHVSIGADETATTTIHGATRAADTPVTGPAP